MRITKQLFLKTLFCSSAGWLRFNEKEREKPDEADLFKREQGREIGVLARGLFPEGILIEEKDMNRAARKTAALMDSPDGTCLFEAAFLAGDYAARADILLKERGEWKLIEVKSSIRNKAVFTADLAYTSLVMELSGCKPSARLLYLLSREYRRGMELSAMFEVQDLSGQVKLRTEEYKKLASALAEILKSEEKPVNPFTAICKNCEYFNICFDFDLYSHIITLPFLPKKQYDKLINQGIRRIQDIPESINLTAHQTLMKRSLIEGGPVISGDLEEQLAEVRWPAFYLDFETTMTALPLFRETEPYQQIPTQYSIHICRCIGQIDSHREYLADADRDCRRDLAEGLIRDLAGEGSILVYSGFEKSVIARLSARFPDLSAELLALIPRLVDLEKIIKNGIYHPAFRGRSSIKKTLPALVPEMHYDDLAIGNGSTALAAFARLVREELPAEETARIRRDLLSYCRQDTLAMVKLHEALYNSLKLRK